MLKTIKRIERQDKEKFKIPKSVGDAIPINRIWHDGIFMVGRNKYSKTFKFTDINYAVASGEDQEAMFIKYRDFLNSFDSESTGKITIVHRRLNRLDFENEILIKEKGDELDKYRKEYNEMLLSKIESNDSMIRELYLTFSIYVKNIKEARMHFHRLSINLKSHLKKLGSKCTEIDTTEKLRLLYDFYRAGEESQFHFDQSFTMKKGHGFKDYICPDTFEFESDHFKMGERYGRVLYLKEYASHIDDDMIRELTSISSNLMMSIDTIPIPLDEALREVETKLLGVETNITTWQRKQNQNHNYSAVVPYDMEQQRKESKEFLDDLTTRDQGMTCSVVTFVHTANTKEELDSDTKAILTTAKGKRCQLAILRFQQMDGLNTALPIGVRRINALRTLTTESLAALMPYRTQEVMDDGGIYFGENAISGNLIMCNKEKLLNPNAFLLGVPGSGKSFSAKELITFIALSTEDDILICDPEKEYASLINALGGEVIRIAAGSKDHINALDMVEGYSDSSDPIADKSEFVLSLFEQLDNKGMDGKQRSIIDRCVGDVYEQYKKDGETPTLFTLYEMLKSQADPEARELALSLELFTSGSLDVFAYETNVDVQNRMIVYDIMDLGRQLKTMGLLVITDAMINRVTENWKKGIRTHIFIDEYHVVFENEHSSAFFTSAWRRFRKRNAFPTAITQNVEFLLSSVDASTMLSNSELIIMLNQAASDREDLARLLNISDEQMSYITNADAGSGLIRYGSSLVPFINQFPKNTELYKLMTTKPNEKWGLMENKEMNGE